MDISFGGPLFGARGPRGTGPLGSLGSRRRTRASLAKRCQTAAEYTGTWGWTVALGVSRTAAGPEPAPVQATPAQSTTEPAGPLAGSATTASVGRNAGPFAGLDTGLAGEPTPTAKSTAASASSATAASAAQPGALLHAPRPEDARGWYGGASDGPLPKLNGRPQAGPAGSGVGDTADHGPARCRCLRPHCPAPGLHRVDPLGPLGPLDDVFGLPALTADEDGPHVLPPGADLTDAQNAWAVSPDAPLLLPVGRSFDLLDVPEPAGHRALARLERMGTRLGPVLATPVGRVLFFVAPGATDALPELLYKTGWDDAGLDLLGHGPGGFLAVPPTAWPGLGAPDWLLPPSESTARQLPEARLLLGTLAYACHRGHAACGRLSATAGWAVG